MMTEERSRQFCKPPGLRFLGLEPSQAIWYAFENSESTAPCQNSCRQDTSQKLHGTAPHERTKMKALEIILLRQLKRIPLNGKPEDVEMPKRPLGCRPTPALSKHRLQKACTSSWSEKMDRRVQEDSDHPLASLTLKIASALPQYGTGEF